MKWDISEEHHAEVLKRLRQEIQSPSEDRDVLKQLCVQVYSYGCPEDAIVIWNAKRLDFDAGISIESELLIGAGLDKTIEHVLENEDLSEDSSASELLNFYRND